MKHYKVISLSLGGPGNQIFHSGQIVTENHFERGQADKLVKEKYLQEVKLEKSMVVVSAPPAFAKEDLMPEITKADPSEKSEQATVAEIEDPNTKAAKLLAVEK
jgi:hypothetical protein